MALRQGPERGWDTSQWVSAGVTSQDRSSLVQYQAWIRVGKYGWMLGGAPVAVLAGTGQRPPLQRQLTHASQGEVGRRIRYRAQGEAIGRLSLPGNAWGHVSAVRTADPTNLKDLGQSTCMAAAGVPRAQHGPVLDMLG